METLPGRIPVYGMYAGNTAPGTAAQEQKRTQKTPPSPRQTMPQSSRTPYSKAPQHSPVFRPYRRRWNAAKRPIPYAAANSPIPSIRKASSASHLPAASAQPADRATPAGFPVPPGAPAINTGPFRIPRCSLQRQVVWFPYLVFPFQRFILVHTKNMRGRNHSERKETIFPKIQTSLLQNCMKKLAAPQRHCQLLSYFRGQD